MEIIPAVDIREGKCVRLSQGKAGTETVYFNKPIQAANFWQNEVGAKRAHFVDLDAALGLGDNSDLISQMIKDCSMKIQIGGGIRTLDRAKKFIEAGADRIVVGTTAIKNPEFINELATLIDTKKIIISLDHIKGKVAVKGWTELTTEDAFQLAHKFESMGVGFILFSSVTADGTFNGPDLIYTKKMIDHVSIPVFAAGGTRDVQDIQALDNIGAYGVIIGKALYERKITVTQFRNVLKAQPKLNTI